jgi:uncharacterized protein (DUF58 family)
MRIEVVPSTLSMGACATGGACALAALISGVEVSLVAEVTAAAAVVLLAAAGLDFAATRRAWKSAAPALLRRLPDALAIGMRCEIALTLEAGGPGSWSCELFDYVDPTLLTEGLPRAVTIVAGTRAVFSYSVFPMRRGDIAWQPADIRVRSRLGLCELRERIGVHESRRVFPDFSQVARYAWLAGDRRLTELGIKAYRRRGEGTDFKQLAEYRIGDSVRHIDWKASQRFGKPIIREFQDERDQRVLFLVDSGRRMRADDGYPDRRGAYFDHVLNAVMLVAYVALRQGDEVGAMTFGAPAGEQRAVAPRKGVDTLNFLMGELYDVQPSLTHSDYIAAATTLMTRQRKRALVIVVTNFRDEDSGELQNALRLLRTRHLVLLASLRERIVNDLASQALTGTEAALEVASAHLYEQSRKDAFNRLAVHDALMVDAVPERLGVELVNRYHAVKKAGLI